jgi:hypothetical protein
VPNSLRPEVGLAGSEIAITRPDGVEGLGLELIIVILAG